MDVLEHFANKAFENSQAVVTARREGWDSKYNEYAIQHCATAVMENLILQAQVQRYDADEAAQEAANNIY